MIKYRDKDLDFGQNLQRVKLIQVYFRHHIVSDQIRPNEIREDQIRLNRMELDHIRSD